jgi:tellurite resistance protein TehA-like permease
MQTLSIVLLVIDIVAYLILGVLLVLRLLFFFSRVKTDINDHVRGPGFFTVVAGTCVLGSALLIVAGRYDPAMALWVAGVTLWIVIMYTFFMAVTGARKQTVDRSRFERWLVTCRSRYSIDFHTRNVTDQSPGRLP